MRLKWIIGIVLVELSFSSSGQEYARILNLTTVYTLTDKETAEIEEDYTIRINSEKGKRFALFRDYTDKFRKVADVSIDVIDHNGKKVKSFNRSDAVEIGYNPSHEINDAKTLVIATKYQNYPYTLVIHTKVKLKGFTSLPTWMPRSEFHLTVDQASLTVIRPGAVEIKFKEENIHPQPMEAKSENRNAVTARYEVKQLAYVDEKVRYQDFYKAQPKVLISPEKFRLDNAEGSTASWVDFGNWYFNLNEAPYTFTPETVSFIASLDKKDRGEVVRKVYEYMQNRTRYVSIQLGIGGFKSLPTEQVDQFGYGDCKALSTYAKNMLDAAGIKSNYVLARAGNDEPDVHADFPSNQFNHVYLGVPMGKDTIYLECTSQILPSNYTGTFTDDRNVLWVEADQSAIIRSKVYTYTENEKKSSITIILDQSGNASVEYNTKNTGVFFDEIMLYKSAPSDYVLNYNLGKFTYDDFALKNFTFHQPEKNTPVFDAKYVLQVNGLAKSAGTKLVFPGVPGIPVHKFIKQDELMKFCSIKRGMTITDEYEIKLPVDYWIYALPEKEIVDSRFGKYSLTTEFDGEKLRMKRTITLFKGDYTQKEFEEFNLFYQKVKRIEGRKLVLNSKT